MADLSTPIFLLRILTVPTAGAIPLFNTTFLPTLMRGPNIITGGKGRIFGDVFRTGSPSAVPLHRRVYLHRQVGGLMVQEKWSDPITGAYLFTDIDPVEKYYVIAFDYEHNFFAIIEDNITPLVDK